MSLLAKALSSPRRKLKKPLAKGELDLVLAYIHGDVTFSQYHRAHGRESSTGSVTHRVGTVIRHAISEGLITVEKTGKK